MKRRHPYYHRPHPVKPTHGARRAVALFVALFSLTTAAVAACVVIGTVAAAVGLYLYFAAGLPPADQFGRVDLTQSTKIYDRAGNLLFESVIAEGGLRTLVKPEQVPTVVKEATIATEDPTFYTNIGVDPVGVLRAIYYNLQPGDRVVGGSTITQQLVKNTLLSPEQSIQRKVQEAILAVEVTRRYTKDEILTSYLNTNFYGNYSYGIQAASKAYFGKDVGQLDLSEAALLAGLPQAPAYYDPCVDVDAALGRESTVLGLMIKSGYIDQAKADAAAHEMSDLLHSPDFDKRCHPPQVQLKAPHFVDYVRQQLENKYGPEVMYRGGLQVTTSIDMNLQQVAEEEARKQIAALSGKNVTNAAVVMLDPHTGQILAMVGSVDFTNAAISGQVNIADRQRQPGSSIKPINYVTAFSQGGTPASPIWDLRTEFPNGAGQAPYVPVNYDGREHGLVSARTALASSLNVPAVKALYFTSTVGPDGYPQPLAMIHTAQKLGITTFTGAGGVPGAPYGLALTLGGGDVKLIELTDAYAAFANNGARMPTTPFVKIVDGRGQVLYGVQGKDKPKPLCAGFAPEAPDELPDAQGNCPQSAPYAYLITSILSDNNARTLGFGPNSVLQLSRPAAVKTGTTNDFRDNWTIGYTPDLVTGVWVGNANNTEMKGVTGVTGAAPIWHNIMERALQGSPVHDFTVPGGVVRATICTDSGLLVTDLCPANHRRDEIFVQGHAPSDKDNVWQQIDCGSSAQVFQVPPHDIRDVIPYDQIRSRAAALGWQVPPAGGLACYQPPPPPDVQPAAPPNLGDIINRWLKNHGKGKKP